MTADPIRIQILPAGTHRDVHGRVVTFSEAALREIADSYDVERDPAPLVLGHPIAMDAPAMGWVDRLEVDGGSLYAIPKDVSPELKEAVRSGSYRKVSASVYQPGHSSSPKPGKHYLRHVGFLGAAAPAIKGMRPVAFAEADADPAHTTTLESVKEADVAEDTSNTETAMTTQEVEPGTVAGAEPAAAPQVVDQAALDRAAVDAERVRLEEERAVFAAEKAKLQSDREAHEAAVRAAGDTRAADAASFAEAQVKAGKLAPAGRALVEGIVLQLDANTAVNFGEGEGELTPVAAFRKLFEGAGTVVNFGEAAPGGDTVRSDPDGEPDEPGTLAERAAEHIAEQAKLGKHVNAAEAVRAVQKKG